MHYDFTQKCSTKAYLFPQGILYIMHNKSLSLCAYLLAQLQNVCKNNRFVTLVGPY